MTTPPADANSTEGTPKPGGRVAAVAADDFSLSDAVGGWRGAVESVLPGTVFVTSYIIWGGFRVPVIAAVSVVAVLIGARILQRTPLSHALGGGLGVVLGAIWAWRAGDAKEYFFFGFWATGATAAALVLSMLLRWPAAGVLVSWARGWGREWREHRPAMRRFQWATGVFLAPFALRLMVQLPLYFADKTGALGTAKLVMGLPLTALSLWLVWLLVRNVALPEGHHRRPQPTE